MSPTLRKSSKGVIDPAQTDLFASARVAVGTHPAVLSPDDMWTELNAQMLTDAQEDSRIERKPARFSPAQLGEYISMWANTEPDGGIVVVGMTDDGAFEGLDSVGTRINRLEKVASIYCPDAACLYKRVPVTNMANKADFVLAIRVLYHASRLVRTTKGDAFVRLGDSMHKLRSEEARELQSNKGEVDFEREPCNLKYPQDFKRKIIRDFVAQVKRRKNWSHTQTDTDVLSLMKLGTIDNGTFIPNIACALMFAVDPRETVPGGWVRFLRFEGEQEGTGEQWNAVQDHDIEGTVPEIIVATDKMIASHLRTFSRLDVTGRFFTQPEYPRTAWYEAVVNACVHRSYGNGLKNTPIFVKMFSDRLVIESPGLFPSFVTPENIYVSHVPRNPYLMEAMRHLDFVKCAHEGTRRMRESMLKMALPDPRFEERERNGYVVRVTLRNNVHQRKAWVDREVSEMIGTAVASTLNENQKRFLNFAAEHGEISVSDAQRLGNLTWPAAKKTLMGLVKLGILRHDVRKDLERDPQARFRLNKD